MPPQGTCLGVGLIPRGGPYRRKPIDVSLSSVYPCQKLKNKKHRLLYVDEKGPYTKPEKLRAGLHAGFTNSET